MEALQRMMTRRLDEHSYKRTAKRLVVDEYANDVDFNSKTEIASLNPAYDIFYGETIRTRTNPNSSVIGASFSTTACSATTSPSSLYHIEPAPTITTITVNDDHSRADKLLRKVSLAVRRKLTGPKPFINGQRNAYIVSNRGKDNNHDDLKSSQRITQNDTEKQIRMKSARKMRDYADFHCNCMNRNVSDPAERNNKWIYISDLKIDLVDAYAMGRKHHSEHRKLLNEEYGDD